MRVHGPRAATAGGRAVHRWHDNCCYFGQLSNTAKNGGKGARNMSDHRQASKSRLMGRLLIVTLAGAIAQPVAAASIESAERLQQLAEALLNSQVAQLYGDQAKVEVQPVDSRLNLKRCSQTPQAFLPPAARLAGSTTVGLRCGGESPWTIYVRARVQVWQSVVVSTRALPRGARLSAVDVAIKRVDVSQLSGRYLVSLDEAADMALKRSVGPAVVLTEAMLGAPVVISRGEQVTLVSANQHMKVAVTGRALSDGAAGERIRVENLTTRRRLEGVVEAPGIVMMAPRSVTKSVTR